MPAAALLAALDGQPRTVADLAAATGRSRLATFAELHRLELAGEVVRDGKGRAATYRRPAAAPEVGHGP